MVCKPSKPFSSTAHNTGGFYDFTSDLTMKDTAYTSLALPAHTDTTYFTDPAGLQMFHLLSHEEGQGGASLLVDGFQVSNTLRRESPRAWNALARIPVTWHASGNDGITITPAKKFPVLNQAPRYEVDALWGLYQVRWNNDDRGAVDLNQGKDRVAQIWYNAAAKFNEILRRKENEYWAQLKPGKPLSRVLLQSHYNLHANKLLKSI
jgi:trimethyllysine dioxygenase